MIQTPKIVTNREINPTIYAYTTPTNTEKKGWVKIGYTERDSSQRIKEQTHTAGLRTKELWAYEARFNGGGYFKDYDFHSYLRLNEVQRELGTEWFNFNGEPEKSEEFFHNFVFGRMPNKERVKGMPYRLRQEQREAVNMAYEYFKISEKSEFLWNAKPRFGKTLSTYELMRQLKASNVLIVTNRPAIANSWFDDYEKFIKWQTDYLFVSDSSSLKDKPTWSRDEYKEQLFISDKVIPQICFIGLQDLKGSIYLGGDYEKFDWVTEIEWDLLVIDEAHEGIDTDRTDGALERVKRKHTLHLSGTPFKQIANSKFGQNQIYNWSYADEQEVKEKWNGDGYNPYRSLPKLNMYTYQMSRMIVDELEGASVDEEDNIDYAFDLNEFFSTKENGSFVHEEAIIKWLNTLTQNEKYPFSTTKLRRELKHTFWYLDRVASAHALAKLLRDHPVFGNDNYKIVVVAGTIQDVTNDGEKNKDALERVKEAIKDHDKTITISVGQLTTGVTVPEWSAVMMLNNVKSPALYMQAAFRAQNPHEWEGKDAQGKYTRYQKENAYIFDFAPERTLIIVDDFANNLNPRTAKGGGTNDERQENIRTLLNFFPVIGEDNEGQMVELDARQVMTIPKNIKAREVVRRGFMSNLLFANISGIFQAPRAVMDIINQFDKTEEGKQSRNDDKIKTEELEGIEVDDNNDVIVDNGIVISRNDYVFGEKHYDSQDVVNNYADQEALINEDNPNSFAKDISNTILDDFKKAGVFDRMQDSFDLKGYDIKKHEGHLKKRTENIVKKFETDLKIDRAKNNNELNKSIEQAETKDEKELVTRDFEEQLRTTITNATQKLEAELTKETQDYQKETVENLVRESKEREKLSIEDEIRSRLRGFSRTIPSFIMAYGDRELKLNNFDEYTPPEVFKEVTGISLDDFIFLRDGGDYDDNGETKNFKGMLFDPIVFNESVQEFLNKREELSNYFEDNHEDIFDYIPSQKTNQIYTPKWVVKMMVQQLEVENPGIYDDSSKTFIDLYMKSGLYITEIIKRLFNSNVIMKEIPNDQKRLMHILEEQVYGLAPTEIIYRIAVRFIFGDLEPNEYSRKNFKQLDAYPYAESGNLDTKLDELFE